MHDSVRNSCWGVTAKAAIGFAGLILLAWMMGASETATIIAAN